MIQKDTAKTIPPQPRLCAMVCCQNNLMPLSWHMPISREPFRYAIAVRDENITHAMLHQHRSFTLNFLPFSYHEQLDACGRVHGDRVEKLQYSGLSSTQSDLCGNIILDESDYVYECHIIDTYENVDHTIFIADVKEIYLNDTPHGEPTLFLGRGKYTTISPITQIHREIHPL